MQQQQQNQGGPPMQSLPIRAYLDQTVVPILLDGMYHRFVMSSVAIGASCSSITLVADNATM
jgi:Dpy-30 motif